MTLSAVEILKAKKNLGGIVYCTPLTRSERLSEMSGAEVRLKLQNLQKTGSFKLRGDANLLLLRISAKTLDSRRAVLE